MDEISIIEYKGARVLTTQQLAEAYGTDTQVITNNYNRNKDRYIEGKHYICLTGQDKLDFIKKNQNDFSSFTRSKAIYLWTEKGTFLHAKSLNTDTAWEVYDRLVESYFRVRQIADDLSPQMKMLYGMLDQMAAAERRAELLRVLKTSRKQSSRYLITGGRKPTRNSTGYRETLTNHIMSCVLKCTENLNGGQAVI